MNQLAYPLTHRNDTVETLHGVEVEFCKKLPQACETNAVNTVAAAPNVDMIHSGVLKYFREIGVVK